MGVARASWQSPAVESFVVEARGAYVGARRRMVHMRSGAGRLGGPGHGRVSEWSERSKSRARARLCALRVGERETMMFCVLTRAEVTYQEEHRRQLLAKALSRRRLEAWWGKEYQARGAVHYNVFVVVPKGSEALFRAWFLGYCKGRWGRVYCEVGRHSKSPSQLRKYALKEGVASAGKRYQQCLPLCSACGGAGDRCGEACLACGGSGKAVGAAGRWWGSVGLRRGWVRHEVSRAEFANLRRLRRSWARAVGRGLASGEGERLCSWVLINGPPEMPRALLAVGERLGGELARGSHC